MFKKQTIECDVEIRPGVRKHTTITKGLFYKKVSHKFIYSQRKPKV